MQAISELLAGRGVNDHFPCWEAHRQRAAELAVSRAAPVPGP
jgi:hypothetical protein